MYRKLVLTPAELPEAVANTSDRSPVFWIAFRHAFSSALHFRYRE